MIPDPNPFLLKRESTVWVARWLGNALTSTRLIGPEFRRKADCLAYIREQWGYIKRRPDLRGPPHYWRVPRPVKCMKIVQELRKP